MTRPCGVASGVLMVWMVLMGSASAEEKPAPRTGKYRGDIVDPVSKEVIMRVALQAPQKLPKERRLGLLVLCHGYDGNEGNYYPLTVDALKRLGLTDDYVVLAGKAKNKGWTTEDDPRMLRLIAWAKETYPIDPLQVYLFGSSNGAAFVGRFGMQHGDIFAGIIGYCGNYTFPERGKKGSSTRWYFVHGGKDNPQNSRRAVDELRKRHDSCVFRQMDGYGHTDIWDGRGHPDRKTADAVRDDWIRWARTEARSYSGPETKEEEEESKPTPAVVRELQDKSEKVRQKALAWLAARASWDNKHAERALCQLASQRDAAVPERLRAVEALGKAMRLPLLGNFKDNSAGIWALVLLLDDENQRVRETAFAALAIGAPDTLGYKPDQSLADRKAALGKWEKWCMEKCGARP